MQCSDRGDAKDINLGKNLVDFKVGNLNKRNWISLFCLVLKVNSRIGLGL
jgi:hypothetical protein